MGARVELRRAWLILAGGVALAIVAFYAGRLFMPLPIFAVDEATYLLRALYPDSLVARDPWVVGINDSVHLSLIRAVCATQAPCVVGDRIVNSLGYLVGLLGLWRASTLRLSRADQITTLLLAIGFPYYRFAFSNLPEGLYVGDLVLLCLATLWWYRRRPVVHSLSAGALAATLVLIKPHGVAVVAGLAAATVLDAAMSGGWRWTPARVLLFALAFFGVGDLIQFGAGEQVHGLTFFVGGLYRDVLATRPPANGLALGLLQLGAMTSAMALLAGPPIVVGLCDIVGRCRADRPNFKASGADMVFLTLLASLGATLVMVSIFAAKVANDPGETNRLWGRYFEFFAPMLWLAAARWIVRPPGRRLAWLCGGIVLAGLAGLMLSFRAGIVLFPWDASILLSFFHPDPVRAPLDVSIPYRALAITATGLAAMALALRAIPSSVGLALTLSLAVLSTDLDHRWLGGMIGQRDALERDVRAAMPSVSAEAGDIVLMASDPNERELAFLRFGARPRISPRPSAPSSEADVARANLVVVIGPATPPGGPWRETYAGQRLSLFRRAGS
jgi:hypothetical protein